jgi:hypothetical protein
MWVNASKATHRSTKLLSDTISLRDQGANVIKKIYRGNLPPFHGNTVILCYKAILPWKLPWNGSKLL